MVANEIIAVDARFPVRSVPVCADPGRRPPLERGALDMPWMDAATRERVTDGSEWQVTTRRVFV